MLDHSVFIALKAPDGVTNLADIRQAELPWALSCHDSARATMICPVLKYMTIQYYLAKLCICMAHISDRGGYLGKG